MAGEERRDDRARIYKIIGYLHFNAKEWATALRTFEKAIAEALLPQGHWMDAFQHSSKTSEVFPSAAYAAVKLEQFEDAFALLEGGKARFLKRLSRIPLWTSKDVDSLLDLVPENSALVMPLVTDQGSMIFVVPGSVQVLESENVVELPLDTKASFQLLERWMKSYFNFGWKTSIDAWEKNLDDVCTLIWDKLMTHVHEHLTTLGIESETTILFVPPNILSPLPFHAARDHRGRYPFTENYSMVYAPSLGLLQTSTKNTPRRQLADGKVLAFLNPSGDLPFSIYELEALQRYVPESRLNHFTDDNVTTDKYFKHAARTECIHFACHGFNDWRDPFGTGLALHDAGLGALSFVQENIDLSATKLVTLSACETGITTAFRRLFGNTITSGGEEYVGLPGTLLAAGVDNILSTLWPVNDYPAALFIEEFYQLLLGKMESCQAALKGARDYIKRLTAEDLIEDVKDRKRRLEVSNELGKYLDHIQSFIEEKYTLEDTPLNHPNYWAAYVLYGSP